MDLEELLSLLKQTLTTSPDTYSYYHWLEQRTIIFNQAVDSNMVEMVYLPLKEFENDDSTKPVTLIVNSVGGSVMDGLALINLIDNYKKPLNIIVYGYACSMAGLILCAGNNNPNVKKYAYPYSIILLHDGYAALEGEAGTVEDIQAFNKRTDNMIKDYVIKNTNISEEEYEYNIHRHQYYMFGEDAKEKGLIDEIL